MDVPLPKVIISILLELWSGYVPIYLYPYSPTLFPHVSGMVGAEDILLNKAQRQFSKDLEFRSR